jgi:hypothetical protein
MRKARVTNKLRRLIETGDLYGALRRKVRMGLDQAVTLARWQLSKPARIEPYDGDPRLALITVNFNTTRWLKLMLMTLLEQQALDRLKRIIIVDNDSRDDSGRFLVSLSRRVENIELVENDFFTSHARGLRLGLARLESLEKEIPSSQKSNLILCCDSDVVFRKPTTLVDMSRRLTQSNASLVGELRQSLFPYPEAQASFILMRRDCYQHPDVVPFVDHGSPAYWMQRSMWCAGLHLEDFPSNKGNYILHRGRSGVSATRTYLPRSPYATAPNHDPHFMGVTDGAKIWREIEQKYDKWLAPGNEHALVERIASKFD